MKELNKLAIELIQTDVEIEKLYAKKKEIVKMMKDRYNYILDICGTTGKTIEDFEEM